METSSDTTLGPPPEGTPPADAGAGRPQPAYDGARRIRWLAFAVAGLVAVYTAGWFLAASALDRGVSKALAEVADDGGAAVCERQDVRGYPFRIGLFCDAVAFAGPDGGLALTGGALRTAAQIYAPNRIVAEFDGPLQVESPGLLPLQLDWSSMRSSARLAEPLPERLSIDGVELAVSVLDGAGSTKLLATVANVQAHMRENGDGIDFAAGAKALAGPDAQAEPIDLEFRASVDDRAALLAAMDGQVLGTDGLSGRIDRLAATAGTDAGGVVLSGPFSVSADGLLSATIEADIRDPQRLADAVRALAPEAAVALEPLFSGLVAIAAPSGAGPAKLTVTIRDGVALAGIIPLGRIPPLFGQ